MPINLGAKKQVNYLEFDGSSDYVDLGNNQDMAVGNFHTITIDFEYTATSTEFTLLFGYGSSGTGSTTSARYGLVLRENEDILSLTSGGGQTLSKVKDLTIGERYSATLVHDNGTIFAYVDGVLEEQVSSGTVGFGSNFGWGLGGHFQGFRSAFEGKIYNAQLWDKALTQQEIQDYIQTKPTGNETNLVAYYDFSDGQGTTLTDQAGNNDGTIEGATWGFDLVDNITKIYKGENEIERIWLGDNNLVFGAGREYELIADVNVTANTTQIDFDNLNITKDDELRLVYTFVGGVTNSSYSLIVNDISGGYTRQRLIGVGSSISASRQTDSFISFARDDRKASGFADIKISNNNKFLFQSQYTSRIGTDSSDLVQYNYNVVNTQTITSINKLSVVSDITNRIAVGSRLQLYKVVR